MRYLSDWADDFAEVLVEVEKNGKTEYKIWCADDLFGDFVKHLFGGHNAAHNEYIKSLGYDEFGLDRWRKSEELDYIRYNVSSGDVKKGMRVIGVVEEITAIRVDGKIWIRNYEGEETYDPL